MRRLTENMIFQKFRRQQISEKHETTTKCDQRGGGEEFSRQ
jgi:hypothetical protein